MGDPASVEEYQRRLLVSYGGTRGAASHTVVVSDTEFRFHPRPVFDLAPEVGRRGVDLVVLYFCISQIVS